MIRHKVRTTMRPDKEIEVTGTELADLEQQGLVADSRPADEPATEPWAAAADAQLAPPPATTPKPTAAAVPTAAAMTAAAEAREKPPTSAQKTTGSSKTSKTRSSSQAETATGNDTEK